jgi:methylated-DNA-[protein]-cysteine S-methyltransferase
MPDSLTYCSMPSPLGELFLAETAAGLCRVAWCVTEDEFVGELEERWVPRPRRSPATPVGVTGETARQIAEYFAGQRQAFDLPLDLSPLRPFQRSVLLALREVGYGETVTYGELATLSGYRGAARAVGGAMRGNPLPIVIPCHRVLPSAGGLGGFGGRPDLKRRLLEIEGWCEPEQLKLVP